MIARIFSPFLRWLDRRIDALSDAPGRGAQWSGSNLDLLRSLHNFRLANLARQDAEHAAAVPAGERLKDAAAAVLVAAGADLMRRLARLHSGLYRIGKDTGVDLCELIAGDLTGILDRAD